MTVIDPATHTGAIRALAERWLPRLGDGAPIAFPYDEPEQVRANRR